MESTIKTIRSIAQDVNEGDTMIREVRHKELRSVWTNSRTRQEYYFKANTLRRLLDHERDDPRLIPVLQFIANQITAPEAVNMIDRLEKLKAFW